MLRSLLETQRSGLKGSVRWTLCYELCIYSESSQGDDCWHSILQRLILVSIFFYRMIMSQSHNEAEQSNDTAKLV